MATEHSISSNLFVQNQTSSSFWYWKSLFNWTTSSSELLSEVEKKILSFLKTPYRAFFVEIGSVVGENDRVWTVTLNSKSNEVPLVLLHGLGSGIGLWVLNLDELAEHRPVFAIDILGFGRSSRPLFSTQAQECEQQFVNSVEAWRNQMNIQEMILLGHSMGGYLACSYAMSHPQYLKHLILADPFGFPDTSEIAVATKRLPFWIRTMLYMSTPFNPLSSLRAAGPFGKWLVQKVRPDFIRKFSVVVEENEKRDSDLFALYLLQCNAQNPTGETAFHSMVYFLGCAKHPMINRIKNVNDDVPITFIYGSLSWVDPTMGERVKNERTNSFVEVINVTDAGHHVYADKPKVFDEYVNEVCNTYKL